MTRRIPRHQDDAPPARNAWWTPRAKRLLATMGPRAVPFRELRSSAERIVGDGLAVDLICAADLRADIIRLGSDYVRTTPRQRERRLAELDAAVPQDVGRDRILWWGESLTVDAWEGA